jgi:hypothetical protein
MQLLSAISSFSPLFASPGVDLNLLFLIFPIFTISGALLVVSVFVRRDVRVQGVFLLLAVIFAIIGWVLYMVK